MDEFEVYTISGKPLKPHEYIIIKKELTAADEAAVQNMATRINGSAKKAGQAEIQSMIGDANLLLVKRMIVRWNLTRTITAENGAESEVPIELSAKAIENLPRRIYNCVLRKINELNEDEEEESDADFLPAVNGHSTATSEMTSLFPLRG